MSFVLGFYVSLIVKRWWEQYKLLPWPDTLALFISAAIPGNVRIEEFQIIGNKSMWNCVYLMHTKEKPKQNDKITILCISLDHRACALT